jgi:hypothetical protein
MLGWACATGSASCEGAHLEGGGRLHAGTMPFVVRHHDKPPQTLVDRSGAVVNAHPLSEDLAPIGRSAPAGFAPHDLKHLTVAC